MCTDIAGLIKGASTGAGLGNAFLSHIQAVDGLFHIVRAFDNDDVVHVDSSIDPIRDLETIQYELCRKDEEAVAKARAAEELAIKKGGGKYKLSPGMCNLSEDTHLQSQYYTVFLETFEKMTKLLEQNIPIRNGSWTTPEVEMINEKVMFQLQVQDMC